MTDQAGALWIPNNNAFVGRNGFKPRYVILHGTAGGTSAQGVANYFASTQGTAEPVSATYVIGTDGTIVQCNSEQDGAWANGVFTSGHDDWWDTSVNPNLVTISIEHCKASSDNSDSLTQAQQNASFTLVHDICQRWNIPMRFADGNGGITGHFSIDPVNRQFCPNTYPWDALWSHLNQSSHPQQQENTVLNLTDEIVQQFFTDGGNGTWKCKKNGVILFGGNLDFYRSNGGPALFGLPLSGEIYPAQYPGTAIVPCERVLIVYDPQHKIDYPPNSGACYLLHIDSGVGHDLITSALQNQIAALGKEVAQLKQQQNGNVQQAQIAALEGKIAQAQKVLAG